MQVLIIPKGKPVVTLTSLAPSANKEAFKSHGVGYKQMLDILLFFHYNPTSFYHHNPLKIAFRLQRGLG